MERKATLPPPALPRIWANSVTASNGAAVERKIFDVLYQHRFKELDGLRGIASLAVGITHALAAFVVPVGFAATYFTVWIGQCLINGGIAVDLFFLMSGFFLAGMMARVTARTLPQFYLRRLARLVPPAVFAVGIFYLYARSFLNVRPDDPNAGPFITDFYYRNHGISLRNLLLNVMLVRHLLNPALWTIRIEIAVSLLFPLLYWVKNIAPEIWYKALLFIMLAALAFVVGANAKLGGDVFHYLYIFYAGALVRERGALVEQLPFGLQYGLLAAAGTLCLLTGFLDPTDSAHPFAFDFLTTVFGSVMLALIGFGGVAKARTYLGSRHVQFLGRISYSFYLMNLLAVRIVALAVMYEAARFGFWPCASVAAILAGSIGLSLLFAALLSMAVEQPSVALSRYLGKTAL